MMQRDILQLLPNIIDGPSGAMKNTLDYFLEEYYFKPSAIVSYSPGMFGGINAAQQLRLVFAELGAPSYPHPSRYQESIRYLVKMVH